MDRNLGETVALGLASTGNGARVYQVLADKATADHSGRSTRYYGSWVFFNASTISPEVLLNRPAKRQSSSGFLRRGNHGLNGYTRGGGMNSDMGREEREAGWVTRETLYGVFSFLSFSCRQYLIQSKCQKIYTTAGRFA